MHKPGGPPPPPPPPRGAAPFERAKHWVGTLGDRDIVIRQLLAEQEHGEDGTPREPLGGELAAAWLLEDTFCVQP